MEINKEECIGCGACASVCPDGIEMKDFKAVIKDDSAECLSEAVVACPVDAIK